MMNHAKGVGKIEPAAFNGIGKFFCIARNQAPRKVEHFESRAGDFETRFRQLNTSVIGAGACKIDGIGPYPAANFDHLLSLPSPELCESGNVWLDKIFALLNFIEVLSR